MRLAEMRCVFRGCEFPRFVFVGAVGFCVDAGLLTLLMQTGWNIMPARSVSFLSAVTCTWILNRIYTFRMAQRIGILKQSVSYIATQVIGAVINLMVFFALIELYPALHNTPMIPLTFGAVASLAFNFTVSTRYVFKR